MVLEMGLRSAFVLQIYCNQVALLSDRAEIVRGRGRWGPNSGAGLREAEEAAQDGDESQPQSRLALSVRSSLEL